MYVDVSVSGVLFLLLLYCNFGIGKILECLLNLFISGCFYVVNVFLCQVY
jgi:hypothetical protein